jgi:hypothetical protein
LPSDGFLSDRFGQQVTLRGDVAVVAAPQHTVDSNWGAGAVYIYQRTGTMWSEDFKLVAGDPGPSHFFGLSVSMNEDHDTLIIGSPQADVGPLVLAGVCYVFSRQGPEWVEQLTLTLSNQSQSDFLGSAVSISGSTAMASAPQHDDPIVSGGAVVVYEGLTDFSVWANLGNGLPGMSGSACLYGTGTLLVGDPVTLSLTNALENATTYFVLGLTEVNLPFYGGTLVPSFSAPLGLFVVLPTNGAGELALPGIWPPGIPGGVSLHFQHWIIDPGGPFGFAASNAVKGTTP